MSLLSPSSAGATRGALTVATSGNRRAATAALPSAVRRTGSSLRYSRPVRIVDKLVLEGLVQIALELQ